MDFPLSRNTLHFPSVILFIGTIAGMGGCGGNYQSQVESLGGKVSLRIDLSNSEVTDDDLEGFGFPEITKEVLLENTGITEASKHLANLRALNSLTLPERKLQPMRLKL